MWKVQAGCVTAACLMSHVRLAYTGVRYYTGIYYYTHYTGIIAHYTPILGYIYPIYPIFILLVYRYYTLYTGIKVALYPSGPALSIYFMDATGLRRGGLAGVH